jgi:hypothetical protein
VWAFVVRVPTSPSGDASRSGVERPDDETKLQFLAEELSVAKEKSAIGRSPHNLHERFEPSIVSVSDDAAGHLVSQCLRRVTCIDRK